MPLIFSTVENTKVLWPVNDQSLRVQVTPIVARWRYGRDRLVSTRNKESGEEEIVNKLCGTLSGLSLGFDRCNEADGAPTRDSTSVHTGCHHSAVRGVFSKGKTMF